MKLRATVLLVLIALAASLPACSRQKPDEMSFFVTSRPAGEGGNIGGLAGADAHCQRLAEAAGSKGRTWRAYLSAAPEGGQPAIHARDRIGRGPWFNSRGVQVAASVEDLHGPANNIGLKTVLPESGERIRFPHDILTGSNPDGTLADGDMTCRNWTSTTAYAMLGHSDLQGFRGRANSWNSAHQSEGCTSGAFRDTGGNGLFYCFATEGSEQ
jgi:hypothetical protein